MTNKQLKDYFARLAKVWLKEKNVDFTELIDSALVSGRDEFWGAAPWAFKERHVTLTTTESQETVNLPDDFEGIVSVIERETSTGFKLQKYTPDEYDRLVPDSAGQSEGDPKIYKVFYNIEEGLWQLALYPTPSSAISLYLTYHTMEDGGTIPKKYIGGLVAGIAQFLFIPGSTQWMGAHNAFLAQIERLKTIDDPDVETIGRFLDASDQPKEWDFEEYMRVGQG